jgi:DNA-binding transcriptional MerR regulator
MIWTGTHKRACSTSWRPNVGDSNKPGHPGTISRDEDLDCGAAMKRLTLLGTKGHVAIAKGFFDPTCCLRESGVLASKLNMIDDVSKMMRIGELAERAGVTLRTIRHYENLGIIPPGEREGSGQHHYPEQTVARLKKINQLKLLGLSLDEIGEVLPLYFSDTSGKRAKIKVLELLRAHLAEVEAQLGSLNQFRSELLKHIQRFEEWLDSRPRWE